MPAGLKGKNHGANKQVAIRHMESTSKEAELKMLLGACPRVPRKTRKKNGAVSMIVKKDDVADARMQAMYVDAKVVKVMAGRARVQRAADNKVAKEVAAAARVAKRVAAEGKEKKKTVTVKKQRSATEINK